MAVAVARHHGGRVLVLRVAIVPAEQPLSDGMLEARRTRAELDAIKAFTSDDSVSVRPIVNVAYALAAGIPTAAEGQHASPILLGLPAHHPSPQRPLRPPVRAL